MNKSDTIAPENCLDMMQVRSGVDSTDLALVALLAQRFRYMDAAARIKTDRNAIRDEKRKTEVIENAKAAATNAGMPPEFIAQIWEQLVEYSIDYELNQWESLQR